MRIVVVVLLILYNININASNTNIEEDGPIGPNCQLLKDRYNHKNKTRHVQLFGKTRNVSIQYGRHSPSRAKAALLVAGLRYRLGYRRISMEAGVDSYCDLVESVPSFVYDNSVYDVMVTHTGAEWAGANEKCAALKEIKETAVGVAPRMQMIGSGSSAPVQLRLHVHLTPEAWNDDLCSGAGAWPFYKDQKTLQHCGFFNNASNGVTKEYMQKNGDIFNCTETSPCVPILFAQNSAINSTLNSTIVRLLEYANHANLRLQLGLLETDAALRRFLRNDSASFLFLDYDIWASGDTSDTRVRTVQPPPCPTRSRSTSPTTTCPSMLDPTSAIFVADTIILAQTARMIYKSLVLLEPHPTELREVLDLESNGLQPEEAACSWAFNHKERFDSWTNTSEEDLWAFVLFCKDEPNEKEYLKVMSKINILIRKTLLLRFKLDTPIDCKDGNSINLQMAPWKSRLKWTQIIGVIAVGDSVAAAASSFENAETQLIIYDVPGAVRLNDAAWTVAGRALQLASAIIDFIIQQNWKRIAIISEETSIAAEVTSILISNNSIVFDKLNLTDTTNKGIKDVLTKIETNDARIVFVNARASITATVLCEAAKRGLTSDTKYAWLAREWRVPISCKKGSTPMRPITISYWWRGGDDNVTLIGGDKKLRDSISETLGGKTWPLMAAPLADAMLLLAHGVNASLHQFPDQRYDLHGQNSASKVTESYANTDPAKGVVQDLHQHNYAQHQPLVFVHSWQENECKLLQVMKVDDDGRIIEKHVLRQAFTYTPHDGTRRCITKLSTDEFNPTCHDAAFFCLGIMLALLPLALWLARRARLKRMKLRERDIHMKLLARCERTAAALSGHLVQRSALQIYEELGVGHFGHVHRGLLHVKQGRQRMLVCVAVKSLRDDAAAAEEAEFLREACALASLQHDHVVKLIGVCAADGPPLLLMEHAFHGDLARYLRERRHLALINLENAMSKYDTKDKTLEATYVSPEQLTRLAREAADALNYLSCQRYVHRDVRAANCMIDQHRSLKLADFGLTRKTCNAGANESDPSQDDYAYLSRRRGLFPVPWMAPESVVHGVFSSMTDVWSLGVLILEICTLGARPFGAWSAPRVLRHVKSGAPPPLPRDVCFDTQEVMRSCWRLSPETRCTAFAIKNHLTDIPNAIHPALRPALEPDGSPNHDSGFGERDSDQDPCISTF